MDAGTTSANFAVIAWCMAQNLQQEASFAALKQAYREGIVGGGKEPYESTELPMIDLNGDGTGATGPAATDMTSGFTMNFGNASTGEIHSTVRVWTKVQTDELTTTDETHVNYIMATVTKADGTEETKEMNEIIRIIHWNNDNRITVKSIDTYTNGLEFYLYNSGTGKTTKMFITFPTVTGSYLGINN